MTATKTYAAKSSVTRAMKAQFIAPEAYTIEVADNGQFYAKMKPVASKKVKEAGTKPRNGNCSAVWEIAEALPGAKRKDVVAACVAKGIPEGTAKTQYQHWFVSKKG
jgi:hypothetical protein